MTMLPRVRYADLFDAEAQLHRVPFLVAAAFDRTDRILDIGCGTGQSTRDAARAAVAGSVLGVDTSAPLVDHARVLTAEAGLSNATYQVADAQTHSFHPEHFDLAISQFGSMFFADPVAAFTNIARALRPGARLVQLVWQHADHNEWYTAIRESLAAGRTLPDPPADGMFSLSDPDTVRRTLSAAGFTGIDLLDVHEPIYYGPNPDTAQDFVLSFSEYLVPLAPLDPDTRQRAVDRLHSTLAAQDTGRGVWFDARTWVITATRR